MTRLQSTLAFVAFSFSLIALGSDIPGGQLRTAEHLPSNTYELVVSPTVVMNGGGAYLTSELRYQPFESLGVGFGFGAGELGFNFGVNAVWHLIPARDSDLEFAVIGGVYFNDFAENNYFVPRVVPTLSQTFFTTWGQVSPYVGVSMAPAFRLGPADSLFASRAAGGVQLVVRRMDGLRILTEVGLNLSNSNHQISVGVSYPFEPM